MWYTGGMETYVKDEAGQWWYTNARQRGRVDEHVCGQCEKRFPNRHAQKFCSKTCAGISQRGNRQGDRPCGWCDKPFTPPPHENRKQTCSHRCAYDLGNSKRGRSGEQNPNWRGGRAPHGTSGYIRVYVPSRGYDLEHRIVMESVLGRRLRKGEHVHHKNGTRDDNRPENLELWTKPRQPSGVRSHEQQHCPICSCN